jgi:hypothetical protein
MQIYRIVVAEKNVPGRGCATDPRIMAPSTCTRNREVAAVARLATAAEGGHGGVAPPHTIAAHLFAASLPLAPPTHDGSIEDPRGSSGGCRMKQSLQNLSTAAIATCRIRRRGHFAAPTCSPKLVKRSPRAAITGGRRPW